MTETDIREALRQIVDPELGINVVDLGLVYGIEIGRGRVRIVMTMTSPTCPLGEYLRDLVRSAVRARIPEAHDVDVDLVWEPPWNPAMMSNDARKQLDGGRR